VPEPTTSAPASLPADSTKLTGVQVAERPQRAGIHLALLRRPRQGPRSGRTLRRPHTVVAQQHRRPVARRAARATGHEPLDVPYTARRPIGEYHGDDARCMDCGTLIPFGYCGSDDCPELACPAA
jgi:hypothetical protein